MIQIRHVKKIKRRSNPQILPKLNQNKTLEFMQSIREIRMQNTLEQSQSNFETVLENMDLGYMLNLDVYRFNLME